MGCYEREMKLVEEGKAQRGQAAYDYFAAIDANLPDEASNLSHRPDYSRTLFAPEHDDIYREFCVYVDQDEPRDYSAIENPLSVEGYTAADIHESMMSGNDRLLAIDAAAIYNMMVKLRTQPEIAKRVLNFKPTCYQNGCGKEDAAYDAGMYS